MVDLRGRERQWWLVASTVVVITAIMALIVGFEAIFNVVPLVHVVGMGVIGVGILMLELLAIAVLIRG